eukprot:scaffold1026_cov164-Alexandrium_tamarense.AAC.13
MASEIWSHNLSGYFRQWSRQWNPGWVRKKQQRQDWNWAEVNFRVHRHPSLWIGVGWACWERRGRQMPMALFLRFLWWTSCRGGGELEGVGLELAETLCVVCHQKGEEREVGRAAGGGRQPTHTH